MTGERNGRWTADSLDRKTCVLRRTLYDMGWSYPTFIPNATNGKIKAELLTVTEAALALMDALEAYPRLYRHEAVQAVLANVSLEAATGLCDEQIAMRGVCSTSWDSAQAQ